MNTKQEISVEQKAKELIERFSNDPFTGSLNHNQSKACALICVEEILKIYPETEDYVGGSGHTSYPTFSRSEDGKYWEQVKQFIEKS